jgi:HEAT repeat protein
MFETELIDLYSGDDEQAEQAVKRLAALPPDEIEAVLPVLASGLDGDDPEKRWWSVRALAALPGDDSVSYLIQALTDPEPQVRQCAALGLRQHPTEEALPGLIARLDDPDSLAARLATDALIAIGKPAALALVEVLQHGGHSARLNAVRALASIGDTRSIPALFEALNNDSALMEYWADLGLTNMGVGTSFFLPD